MPIPLQEELSARALAETPVKALMFLGAVSSSTSIRDSLLTRGFTQAVHDRFWRLLHDATGQQSLGRPSSDEQVRVAVARVATWEDPHFRISRATLAFDFPDAFAYVFTGLEAASGLGSLVSVMRFLDRLDDLERSPDRKATRKTDHAALAKLAERGITPEERARVRRLVLVAERSSEGAATPEAPPVADTSDALVRLRAMYDEWSEIARIVVTRRSDLIRLGLAKRRRSSTKGGEAPADGVNATATPTPPPVAAAWPVPVFTPAPPPVAATPPAAVAPAPAPVAPAPTPPAAVAPSPVAASPSPANGSPSNGAPPSPGAPLPS